MLPIRGDVDEIVGLTVSRNRSSDFLFRRHIHVLEDLADGLLVNCPLSIQQPYHLREVAFVHLVESAVPVRILPQPFLLS